jgi:DNA-binding NarL/FixJ family response regulator
VDQKKHILVAESRETLRKGLRVIFAEEPDVACVNEAASSEELYKHLTSSTFDLVVVHQSLITDIARLPRGRFVILSTRPDFEILLAALCHGMRAYLSENTSGRSFRQLLQLSPGTFLIDEIVSSWVVTYLSHHLLLSIDEEHLTPREQEILHLLWRGYQNQAIAEQLSISNDTLKTHVKHIYRKLGLNRHQAHILSLPDTSDCINTEARQLRQERANRSSYENHRSAR